MSTHSTIIIDEKSITVAGRFVKMARLEDELYVPVEDPKNLIEKLIRSNIGADIFTFCQEIDEPTPKYGFHQEWQSLAVLTLTTYEEWFNHRITFKPRNKIRKAHKCGVQTRVVGFCDELVRGIRNIYNETPVRQGRQNLHYGKDFETVKREHATFLDKSDIIGAYYKSELIGFAKVTHLKHYSILMNIVAMISHRDKAPANALIAKTIEVCAQKSSLLLNYGIWSRRGMSDFKVASKFERCEIPRYFVPLTCKGKLALRLNLHHKLVDLIPESCLDLAADVRTRWNEFKYRNYRVQTDEMSASEVTR